MRSRPASAARRCSSAMRGGELVEVAHVRETSRRRTRARGRARAGRCRRPTPAAGSAPAWATTRCDRSRRTRRGRRPRRWVQISRMASTRSRMTAKRAGRVGAVVAHLLEVPAGPDAELEAPAGEVVERGRLVGEHDRVALDDQRDAGADAQALGRGGDRAERDERVERVRVLARQLVAARPRALAAGRDVRVLGDEDRVEAGVLGGAAERDGRDRLVGDEHRQAELHWATSGARSPAGGRRPARGRPAASRARCRSARRPWPAASGARRGSRRPA